LQIRHRFIQNLEDAVLATDAAVKQSLLTIVIVGGGPTGVEMSGAIAEMKKYVLPQDYPEIDFDEMKIYLLEGGSETLAAMSDKSSQHSLTYLTKLGVEVKLDTILKDYDGKIATLSTGETIETATVIWAAGVKGNIPTGIDSKLIVRGNRIIVNRFNQVKGLDGVYAIGDVAYMETPNFPTGHPQLANVAINQGKLLANNLRWQEMKSSQRQVPFEYNDKGTMATVGRNLAVVDIPKPRLHFGGFFAWLIWMGLHLVLILGVKNRLQVFINWIYNYLTYDQSLRLIFPWYNRPGKEQEVSLEKNKEIKTL
jgi:NADH:ubiquinone reductase (H+-translocating)